jgi:hypothetical protein
MFWVILPSMIAQGGDTTTDNELHAAYLLVPVRSPR